MSKMRAIKEKKGGSEPDKQNFEQEEDYTRSRSRVSRGLRVEDDNKQLEHNSGYSSSTSEGDVEEYDRQETEMYSDMMELDEQFTKLSDLVCDQQKALIDLRLKAIEEETDEDYLQRVEHLRHIQQKRIQVADILLEEKRKAIEQKFESEKLAIDQTMENEKWMLHHQMKEELTEMLKQLKDDRCFVEFKPDFYQTVKPFPSGRRKKPAVVSDIIYQLKDDDVQSDWIAIKKVAQQKVQKRISKSKS